MFDLRAALLAAGADEKSTTRFVAKVRIAGEDDCWPWLAASWEHGHGAFWDSIEKRQVAAYRWLYVKLIGVFPPEFDIDHLCRNPSCVNPKHLEAVPHQTNIQRGVFSKTFDSHCKNGHEWNEENTRWYMSPLNGRPYKQCSTCCRERQRARRLSKSLAKTS